jgi:hypothetical protein
LYIFVTGNESLILKKGGEVESKTYSVTDMILIFICEFKRSDRIRNDLWEVQEVNKDY